MITAGLTGGLACGKSFVGAALRDLGCRVVEADELGHQVLRPDGAAFRPVVEAFGAEILNTAGEIDRSRLGAIVFSDPAALARLNAIVHPAVRRLALQQFRDAGERDPGAIVVYVAAILIETGGHKDLEKLIVVSCSREQQIARALRRSPGAKERDILARLDRQWPIEEKVRHADYVIDSGGTPEETLRQTKMVFEELKRLAS